MKRAFPLVLSLLVLPGFTACSAGGESTGTGVASEMTAAQAGTAAPASEPETEETVPEHPVSDRSADFQAGIPEKYRVKINIPADWKDPLPSSDADFDSPLFGLGQIVDEQKTPGEPMDLPRVIDLFTIEELEAYFDMVVKVDDEESLMLIENQDSEKYLLYDSDTSTSGFSDGVVYISLTDWCDPLTAASYMSFFSSEQHVIEDLGQRAHISASNSVTILVADTVIMEISAEFDPPEGGPKEPLEEEPMLEFARLVYERFVEKLKSMEQAP